MTTSQGAPDGPSAQALAERVTASIVGALEVTNIHLGHRLGLYATLAAGPVAASELAAAAACDERYVIEWLQAQVVSGFVTIDTDNGANALTYALAPGAHDVLADELSPHFLAPKTAQLAAIGRVADDLAAAFRTGGGVPYAAYGADAVASQAASSRVRFHHELVATWIAAVPDVERRLRDRARGARVADLGCGGGWSSIAIAEAFPDVLVEGFDADATSVALAAKHAADAGVADRVGFGVHDLSDPLPVSEPVDIVLLLKCLHDVARPDLVLANARRALAPGGTVLVLEPSVDAELTPRPDDDIQRYYANASTLWCLPQARVRHDARPFGTVMRPAALAETARAAGFAVVETVAVDHPNYRMYRLHPEETPGHAIAPTSDLLDRAVRREPLVDHGGASGARLDRIVLDDGRRLIVKESTFATDLARQISWDSDGREARLFVAGMLDGLPHEIVDAWWEGDRAVTVMTDLSSWRVGWRDRIDRAEMRALIRSVADVYAAYAGKPAPDGLLTVAARVGLETPPRLRACTDGSAEMVRTILHGWELFARIAPADVVAAVLAIHADPAILAAPLADRPATLIHGDFNPGNTAVAADGRTARFIDWGFASWAPPAMDLSWFLATAGTRVTHAKEDVIADFRAAIGELDDAVAMRLALLDGIVELGWLMALRISEATTVRDRASLTAELEWWIAAARDAIDTEGLDTRFDTERFDIEEAAIR